MHTWPLALLLAFFTKALLSFSSKKPFFKMYAPFTNTSRVHTLFAPLQLVYIHMLHHYIPRILAKFEKTKKLQGIH